MGLQLANPVNDTGCNRSVGNVRSYIVVTDLLLAERVVYMVCETWSVNDSLGVYLITSTAQNSLGAESSVFDAFQEPLDAHLGAAR